MKFFYFLLSSIIVGVINIQQAQAGDPASGKLKVEQVCHTCHGLDGMATIAGVPNLSGQQEEYLIHQLEAFRSGQRQHAQMSIVAKGLTDDDIENVAAWFSSIKISVESPQ